MEQNNITSKQVWVGILLVSILIAGYWLADRLTSDKENKDKQDVIKEVIKEIIVKRPTCPDASTSFDELKNASQIVTLAKDLNSYGQNNQLINTKYTLVKSVGSGSQIACGYLYVKAHVGNRPLQLEWEHPYVKPGQFGGHIITENAIVNREVASTTELLFNLSNITYRIDNNTSEIEKADWAALFNVTNKIKFEIALNTTDPRGTLDEVSIAYQCWSPETGQITHDCRMEVE